MYILVTGITCTDLTTMTTTDFITVSTQKIKGSKVAVEF